MPLEIGRNVLAHLEGGQEMEAEVVPEAAYDLKGVRRCDLHRSTARRVALGAKGEN
jgi:hypothetical protein